MMQPTFPSTSEAQSRNVPFLTTKTVGRKFHQNDGHTGSCAYTRHCLRKWGGGGIKIFLHHPKEHPGLPTYLGWCLLGRGKPLVTFVSVNQFTQNCNYRGTT